MIKIIKTFNYPKHCTICDKNKKYDLIYGVGESPTNKTIVSFCEDCLSDLAKVSIEILSEESSFEYKDHMQCDIFEDDTKEEFTGYDSPVYDFIADNFDNSDDENDSDFNNENDYCPDDSNSENEANPDKTVFKPFDCN